MQRYCPHCKNELPEDASFCLCCFSRLIESESEPEPAASRRVTATLRITGLSVVICLFSVLGGSDIYMNHPPLTGVVPPSPALSTSDASYNKPPYKTRPPASLTASAAVTPSSLAQTTSASLVETAPESDFPSHMPTITFHSASPEPSPTPAKTPPVSSSPDIQPSGPDHVQDGDLVDFNRYPFADAADFTWIPYESGISITQYNGQGGVVRIPPTLDGMPVVMIDTNAFRGAQNVTHIQTSAKHIGAEAFQDCCNLVQADLPGVQYIHTYAFCRAASLISVSLYEGLTMIGSAAFAGCSSLTQLELPDTVQRLEAGIVMYSGVRSLTLPASVRSFDNDSGVNGCENLEEIWVDPANPTYYSVDGVLFQNRGTSDRSDDILLYYPPGKTDISYTVYTDIAPYAIAHVKALQEVIFTGQRALDIGENAFQFCLSLERLQFSAPIGEIGANAFLECDSLLSCTLPAQARSLGVAIFNGCNNLVKIIVPGTLDLSSLDRPVTEGLYYATLYVKENTSGEAHAKRFSCPYVYY